MFLILPPKFFLLMRHVGLISMSKRLEVRDAEPTSVRGREFLPRESGKLIS